MTDTVPAVPAAPPPPPPPPVVTEPAAPPAAPVTPPPAEPIAPTADPVQARFDVLTRQKWDEKRRADAAEARATAAEARLATPSTAPAPEATPSAPSQQQWDPSLITREATRLVEQREFNARCDKLATTAKGKFADFDATLQNFNIIGGLGNQVPLVQAMIAEEIDNGADVLYHLGKNIAEADRISQLPPVQMAIAVARLSDKLRAVPATPISGAPEPITPITPGASGTGDPVRPDGEGDFKSQADYRAWRAKNKKR